MGDLGQRVSPNLLIHLEELLNNNLDIVKLNNNCKPNK